MTRWEILGSDRETGEDKRLEIEADDETAAVRAAGAKGLVVSAARALPVVPDYRGRRNSDPTPALPAGALLPGETAIFDDGGTLVTNKRFVTLGKTCVVANIASVDVRRIPPDNGWLKSLGGFAVIIAVAMALVGAGSRNGTPAYVIAILAGVVGVTALWAAWKVPSICALVVVTSAGELEVLRGEDPRLISSVLDALNQAIVSRT